MEKPNIPIVVVEYNRPKALNRLLTSLSRAEYNSNNITLIISIDFAHDNQDVLLIAKSFLWEYGEKQVKYSPKNLGLRRHILQCGDYATEYGNVIILEDDLYVAPDFYNFSQEALLFCQGKPEIGGVSLYNHQQNVHTNLQFNALDDGYDNWYFQFASSWGQAWSAEHWQAFKTWYKYNTILKNDSRIPNNVLNWSDKSWLKYFIVFLIEKNQFFLYPQLSQSTNFGDQGTHVGNNNNDYQVPFSIAARPKYCFSEVNESTSVYDAFFENKKLALSLGIAENDISIDLYGYRSQYENRYILTSKILNYRILNSFGRALKPIDLNIIMEIEGKDIFLYDSTIAEINHSKPKKAEELKYFIKGLTIEKEKIIFEVYFKIIIKLINNKLRRKIG